MSAAERPSPYSERLGPALEEYTRVSGRNPEPALLDPTLPNVQSRYRAFASRSHRLPLGANTAEWLALRSGIKPMLREVMPLSRWSELEPRYRDEGFVTGTGPTLSEDSIEGQLFPDGTSGPEGRPRMPPTRSRTAGESERIVCYVARDTERIQEAASLDQALVTSLPDAEQNRRMGELLGYPDCCVEHVAAHTGEVGNHPIIARTAAATRAFEPLLNNLTLSAFHYIAWFPCRYDCHVSLRFADRIRDALSRESANAVARIQSALAMPRIYLDDRRQLIFDGRVTGSRIRYRDVLTPFALDGSAASAAFEWVFYADIAAACLEGDELEFDGGSVRVLSGGSVVTTLDLGRDAIWLPFGAGSAKSE